MDHRGLEEPEGSGIHRHWRWFLALAGVLAVAMTLTLLYWGYHNGWQPEQIGAWLEARPYAGPLLLMLLLAVMVVLPLPALPLTIAAGVVYGPGLGTLYATAGALMGAVAAFWIARLLGREVIAHWLPKYAGFCQTCSHRLLFSVVLIGRLLPPVSFALLSYASGLTPMTTRAFAVATLLGMLPPTFIYVTLGATFTVHPIWAVAASVLLIAGLFALPYWVERRNPWNIKRFLPR
jgi:uncharacterized membrane protein YdjX (TVP38/TMEM64 family)